MPGKRVGSLPKRMVEQWLARKTDEQVFNGSVGREFPANPFIFHRWPAKVMESLQQVSYNCG